MEIIKTVFFGLIEGITEWLPVSSTGHLILFNEFVHLNNVSDEFLSMFDVVIQLGAIMAVVILFWDKLWPFTLKNKGTIWKKGALNLWIKIIIACIPAAIVGVLFDDIFEKLFYNPVCVSIALIVVGIIFIIVENTLKIKKNYAVKTLDEISFRQAFIIGLFQLIAAIFPGTSRSGSTIIGGLSLGMKREVITEFTFLLAVPVMFGASLLKGIKYVKYLLETNTVISGLEVGILSVGSLIAFFTSLIVIKFLMSYIKKHDFKIFGYYRIILGLIILLYFLFN